MIFLENGGYPDYSKYACAEQANYHRREGFAHAPQGAGEHLHIAADEIQRNDCYKPFAAVCYNLRIVIIKPKELIAEQHGYYAHYKPRNGYQYVTVKAYRADTVVFLRANVLAGERYRRLRKAVYGNVYEAFQIACRGAARHYLGAEGIDGGLYQHV